MNESLVVLVLVVLAGIAVLGILVLLIRHWRRVLTVAALGVVVVGAAVVLCEPLGLPFCRSGGGGGPGGGTTGLVPGASGPPVTVQNTGSGLLVTNHSGALLTVRAAYVVPLADGNVGVCNPSGPPGNRVVPSPEVPNPAYDQELGPFRTITVPAVSCPHHTGYSVWVRDLSWNLVFQQSR